MNPFNSKTFFVMLVLASWFSCNFAPGSYPYAEIYEFQIEEDSLIKIVNKFKSNNSVYKIPEQYQFFDGKIENSDQWYHLWFYYPEDDIVVKCWIRTSNNGTAEIGFVGIGEGLSLANYKEINKDFSFEKNNFQKKKFERLILNKLLK